MRNCNLGKRVLVTGGAGFLGSHLCRRLLGDCRDVLGVDDFFTGTRDNTAHLIADRHFELTQCSVSPTSILSRIHCDSLIGAAPRLPLDLHTATTHGLDQRWSAMTMKRAKAITAITATRKSLTCFNRSNG